MSKRSAAIGLLLASGMAIVLWLIFAVDSPRPLRPAADERAAASNEADDSTPTQTDTSPDDADSTDPESANTTATAESTDEPATEKEPKFEFLIEGQVFSDTGAALRGAQVRVIPFRRLMFSHQVLDLFGNLQEKEETADEPPAATAESDASGWFRAALPGPGRYLVEVTARNHTRAIEAPIKLSKGEPHSVLFFHLPPGRAIRGFLETEAGRRLSGVPVFLLEKLERGGRTYHPHRVTTGGAGDFAFEGLAARSYILMAKPMGSPGGIIRSIVAPEDDVIVTIPDGNELEAQVVDAQTREPIPGATVTALNPVSYDQIESDGQGSLALLLGGEDADVVIHHPDYVTFEQRIDFDSAPFTFAMQSGARLRGRVMRDDGSTVSGVQVCLMQDANFLSAIRTATTDQHGAFEIGPAQLSRPAVILPRVPGWVPELSTAVRSAGDSDVLVQLQPASKLVGQVIDSDGNPVIDAWVRLGFGSGDSLPARAVRWLRGEQEAWTDTNGVFRFDDVVPMPGYRLEVQHPDFADSFRDLGAFPDAPVMVRANGGTTLEGRVTDDQGEGIASALVFVQWPGGPPVQRNRRTQMFEGGVRALTGFDGKFFVGQLPAGPVTVYVQGPPYLEKQVKAMLSADEPNELQVTLIRGQDVRVRLFDEEGNPEFGEVEVLSLGNFRRRRGRTDADGIAVFTSLPPGSYQVRTAFATAQFSVSNDASGVRQIDLRPEQ